MYLIPVTNLHLKRGKKLEAKYNDLTIRFTENETAVFHSMVQLYIDNFIHHSPFQQLDIRLAMSLRNMMKRNNVPRLDNLTASELTDCAMEMVRL